MPAVPQPLHREHRIRSGRSPLCQFRRRGELQLCRLRAGRRDAPEHHEPGHPTQPVRRSAGRRRWRHGVAGRRRRLAALPGHPHPLLGRRGRRRREHRPVPDGGPRRLARRVLPAVGDVRLQRRRCIAQRADWDLCRGVHRQRGEPARDGHECRDHAHGRAGRPALHGQPVGRRLHARSVGEAIPGHGMGGRLQPRDLPGQRSATRPAGRAVGVLDHGVRGVHGDRRRVGGRRADVPHRRDPIGEHVSPVRQRRRGRQRHGDPRDADRRWTVRDGGRGPVQGRPR